MITLTVRPSEFRCNYLGSQWLDWFQIWDVASYTLQVIKIAVHFAGLCNCFTLWTIKVFSSQKSQFPTNGLISSLACGFTYLKIGYTLKVILGAVRYQPSVTWEFAIFSLYEMIEKIFVKKSRLQI